MSSLYTTNPPLPDRPIHIPPPSIHKGRGSGRDVEYVDIDSLKWTLRVPEAHAIVETALYRGFFDIVDRAELNRLRLCTETALNHRISNSKKKAEERLEQYKIQMNTKIGEK